MAVQLAQAAAERAGRVAAPLLRLVVLPVPLFPLAFLPVGLRVLYGKSAAVALALAEHCHPPLRSPLPLRAVSMPSSPSPTLSADGPPPIRLPWPPEAPPLAVPVFPTA